MVAGTGLRPCSKVDAPQMCFLWSEVARNIARKPQKLARGAERCPGVHVGPPAWVGTATAPQPREGASPAAGAALSSLSRCAMAIANRGYWCPDKRKSASAKARQ